MMLKGIALTLIIMILFSATFIPRRKNVMITCYEGGVETIDTIANSYVYVLGAHIFETPVEGRFIVTGSCIVENMFPPK